MKTKIPEGKLLKALTELEESVDKGDALEEADPEGGLSTEGEPLSDAAPRGRGDGTKKSRRGSASSVSSPISSGSSSSSSSSDAGSSIAEMMSSKESSSDKPKKKGKKKAVSKAERASTKSSADSGSDDDGSSDDASSDAEKSFRQRAEGDETMAKAIIVNDFIEAMVDQLSLSMRSLSKSMTKAIGDMEKRMAAHIDNRVAKSAALQQGFNARLAKAIAAIGNTVQDDLVNVVKSLSDQPVTAPRGKAVLSKGEVNQPPWSGPQLVNADQRLANGADDYVTELGELSPEAIGDWLFKKSAQNQIDPKLIMAWEADRYAVEALPVQVRKALVNDLIK